MPCERCLKRPELCLCAKIRPLEARHSVLILQHPQEPDKDLGSARLAHLSLPGSVLKIGLSWPNLRTALGREVQPSKWAALYLGSGIQAGAAVSPKRAPDAHVARAATGPQLRLVNKKGVPLPDEREVLDQLEGILVIDGTWSQAKALWWRNAWLLKLRRAILVPGRPSLYGSLRKEPRKECVSTIETVALALEALGEPKAVSEELLSLFRTLLQKERDRRKSIKGS